MTLAFSRTLFVTGLVTSTVVGAAACSSGPKMVSKDEMAKQISARMTNAAGNKPDSVSCPDGLKGEVGAQINCAVKIKGQDYSVNVTATSVKGDDVEFDMVETVDKELVANKVSERMTEKNGRKPDSVTCPDNLKGRPGSTLRCELEDGGRTHGVTVTVTGVDDGDVRFGFKFDDQPE